MKTFFCKTGGAPENLAGVLVAERNEERKYRTVRNGYAHEGELVVDCASTGRVDEYQREVFVDTRNTEFVFCYRKGSPYQFDRGALVPPGVTPTWA